MSLVKFEDNVGMVVFVNPDNICSVHERSGGTQTEITLANGGQVTINASPDIVVASLNSAMTR